MGTNDAFRCSHAVTKPHALSKAIPPAVFVLFLLLRLGRTEENEFAKFSNGFNAAPALDSLKAGLATCADDIAVDNAGGVLDTCKSRRTFLSRNY